MHRLATAAIVLVGSVFLASCGMNSPTAPSPVTSSLGISFTRAYEITGTVTDADKSFITFAAQAYQAQITLGELAESRGDTAEVKAFGRQMRQDATAILATLRAMAPAGTVATTITLNTQQAGWVTTLSGQSGSDSDRTYIGFMLTEFANNMTRFTAQSSTGNAGLRTHAADYAARLLSLQDDLDQLARRVGLRSS